ncbi:unnamed protein product [Schistocephalus solidus]|uniref:Uncharacterized protein n=1 Tax=Schistocephalus solidus TaxID=70667 RepID=A0A183TED4_SCHSO|nr:unnamed protein product [Schistocephalus solidus]
MSATSRKIPALNHKAAVLASAESLRFRVFIYKPFSLPEILSCVYKELRNPSAGHYDDELTGNQKDVSLITLLRSDQHFDFTKLNARSGGECSCGRLQLVPNSHLWPLEVGYFPAATPRATVTTGGLNQVRVFGVVCASTPSMSD